MPNRMIERLRQARAKRVDVDVRLMFRSPIANIIAVVIVAAVVASTTGFVLWLALGEPRLAPSKQGALTPSDVYDGIKIALTVVGGIGGVVALVVAYRKQRYAEREHLRQEAAAAREDTKLYADRFRAASEQLGSDRSAIRLAGVYAMASLADDWPSGRQTCIDVLCAYLRMPYAPPGESVAPETNNNASMTLRGTGDEEQRHRHEERQVRHTVIRLIGAHLGDMSAVSWQGHDFDFTGATLDGGNFRRARFAGGAVSFGGATFSGGTVDFGGATFSGSVVDFGGATFSGGTVDFGGVTFSGSTVCFCDATFSGSKVSFRYAKFAGGTIEFHHGTFSGGMIDFLGAMISSGSIDLRDATFSGGKVSFNTVTITGGKVDFRGVTFSGATVSFSGARFAGGNVAFNGATFSAGSVGFEWATFPGARVNFGGAKYSGGKVDFGEARFESGGSVFADFGIPTRMPAGVIPPAEPTAPTIPQQAST
jgi:uncharacterized protein YjbI with pentapeptide repeats